MSKPNKNSNMAILLNVLSEKIKDDNELDTIINSLSFDEPVVSSMVFNDPYTKGRSFSKVGMINLSHLNTAIIESNSDRLIKKYLNPRKKSSILWENVEQKFKIDDVNLWLDLMATAIKEKNNHAIDTVLNWPQAKQVECWMDTSYGYRNNRSAWYLSSLIDNKTIKHKLIKKFIHHVENNVTETRSYVSIDKKQLKHIKNNMFLTMTSELLKENYTSTKKNKNILSDKEWINLFPDIKEYIVNPNDFFMVLLERQRDDIIELYMEDKLFLSFLENISLGNDLGLTPNNYYSKNNTHENLLTTMASCLNKNKNLFKKFININKKSKYFEYFMAQLAIEAPLNDGWMDLPNDIPAPSVLEISKMIEYCTWNALEARVEHNNSNCFDKKSSLKIINTLFSPKYNNSDEFQFDFLYEKLSLLIKNNLLAKTIDKQDLKFIETLNDEQIENIHNIVVSGELHSEIKANKKDKVKRRI